MFQQAKQFLTGQLMSHSVHIQHLNSTVLVFSFPEYSHRGCVIYPNSLCYVCGEYTAKSQQRNISEYVKKVHFAYFKLKFGDQDKAWAPYKVCRRCKEDLHLWFKGKKNSFCLGISMIWREKTHTVNCYFCSVDVKGFNTSNKLSYPNLDSAIRSVSVPWF